MSEFHKTQTPPLQSMGLPPGRTTLERYHEMQLAQLADDTRSGRFEQELKADGVQLERELKADELAARSSVPELWDESNSSDRPPRLLPTPAQRAEAELGRLTGRYIEERRAVGHRHRAKLPFGSDLPEADRRHVEGRQHAELQKIQRRHQAETAPLIETINPPQSTEGPTMVVHDDSGRSATASAGPRHFVAERALPLGAGPVITQTRVGRPPREQR